MTWDDVLERLTQASLHPREEVYMEHYGKVLAAQRPEFKNRIIRCTYGKIHCAGIELEVFLFPSEVHLQDFMELLGDSSLWLVRENAVLHFPPCDAEPMEVILKAVTTFKTS